ncbi:Phospholipase/carboxylesterase [Marasmius fiardii PR-910]|nr:Phospholipase/carboxylesterase [Marasmius fiardii PR-910]
MITEIEPQEVVHVPATAEKTAAVIFVHGLGQSNLTWSLLAKEALAPKLPHVEWILPQAHRRPVSLNQGQLRPSWFNITRLPPDKREYDESAITESISRIESLILSQVHSGIDSRRIVLVGFSQGAALSLMTAFSTLHELGGVASLSGWIPEQARPTLTPIAKMPILWCHGLADDEIPIECGCDAVEYLRSSLGASNELQFRTYQGLVHTICDEEVSDLSSWLESVLGV